jgi:citrate lyase beta subunit
LFRQSAFRLFVDKLLTQLEKDLGIKSRIGLECLIEEVEGMMNIERIAASTRLKALIFGMGDYSATRLAFEGRPPSAGLDSEPYIGLDSGRSISGGARSGCKGCLGSRKLLIA